MGQPGTGNKADLIDRALTALSAAREIRMCNPNDNRFSAFLQYIALENGGTLHAGYKRSSPPKSAKSSSPAKSVVDRSKIIQQQPSAPVGSKATASASRPFENVTYINSPYNVFASRLYTKVIDGRQGMMLINDFVLNPVTCESLVDHRIKLYMGNPMNTMPFGMSKVIDVFFSDACWITVNGKQIPENVIIPNKKKIWACNPPDITDLLNTKPGIANKIEVRFSAMIPKCMVTVELVKVISPEKRVEIICEKHRYPKIQVLEEKKRSFLADEDIVATSEAISLRDPILQVKINKPGRSISCKHTQCFDLDTFFSMNEKSNTFICPICNNRIKWDNIILDEYFEEILKVAADSDDIDTIEIQPDGSWSLPTKELKNDHPVKKENDFLQDNDIMILSSDEEDNEEPQSMQPQKEHESIQPEKEPQSIQSQNIQPQKEPIHANTAAGLIQASPFLPNISPFAITPVSSSFPSTSASLEPIADTMNVDGRTASDVIDLTLSSDEEDTTAGDNLGPTRIENLGQLGSNSANNIQPRSVEPPTQVLAEIQTSRHEAHMPLPSIEPLSQVQAGIHASDAHATIPVSVNASQSLAVTQTSEYEPQMPSIYIEPPLQAPVETQAAQSLVVTPVSLNEAPSQVQQLSENDAAMPLCINEVSSHTIDRDASSADTIERALEEALVQLESRVLPSENIRNANLNGSGKLHVNSGEEIVVANDDILVIAPPASSTTIQAEDHNSFETNELDGILSSLPDSLFSQENNVEETVNLKSRKKTNAPKLNSSRLNVSIPTSPNDTDSNDLDRFLSSIPDDISGIPDFSYKLLPRESPSAHETDADNINLNESINKTNGQNNMVEYGNEDLPPINDSRRFSLKVTVGNDLNPALNEDRGNSSNLLSEDCVLTPSPGVSDDDCESSPRAKENIIQPNLFSTKQQLPIKNSNQIQIEKTWTTQDEEALRQIAESIFAEMDAQNRKNNLKRSFPDD